jgi:hypothetical protein
MSRVTAIILAIFLLGLAYVEAVTEQNPFAKASDGSMLILNVSAEVLLALGLFLYCGFAALHSTQYVVSPRERSLWLIVTIVLNVLGSCWYFLTAYQAFRKLGKGRLMSLRKGKDA